MYDEFYGFKEKPFSLTPDPKFLYLSKQHQGAMDHMLYGIKQREGFLVIVGDVGTGKTTLCRCLLGRLGANVEVALILNPLLSDMDLLRACIHDLRVRSPRARRENAVLVGSTPMERESDFGSSTPPLADTDWINKASKKELIDALNTFLLEQHRKGGSTVLIIDEAQNLTRDVLEQLRILSNLETEKEKLLQVIFFGQLEFNEKLKLPSLKQLNQRISIRYEITPLSREEMKNYINHRILVAGAGSRIVFTRAALNEIFNFSNGYPRLINLVCDRALLAGFNAQVDTIDTAHVKQGVRSLLGDEEKNYFFNQFVKKKLPVAASFLFFLAGLLFFLYPITGGKWLDGIRDKLASVQWAEVPLNTPAVPGSVAPAANPPSAKKAESQAQPADKISPPSDPATPAVTGKTPAAAAVSSEVAAPASVPTGPEESPGAASPEQSKPENGPASAETPVKSETLQTRTETPAEKKKIEAKESLPTDVAEDGFRIQVFSLSQQSRAEKEVKKLQKEGFDTFWKKVQVKGEDWYVVYVGPFKEASTARIYLNALKLTGREPILQSLSKSG